MFKSSFTVIFSLAVMFTALSGCKKNLSYMTCKNDSDCKVDSNGKNHICYMGKCEECAKDTDCVGLEKCRNNRCVEVCDSDGDCNSSQRCEEGICLNVCSSDADCDNDETCSLGRCIPKTSVSEYYEGSSYLSSECGRLQEVHFDFDRFTIKDSYRSNVKDLAECLKNNPGSVVTIEGHTDERGTKEYNLVLGEKRANAIKEILTLTFGINYNQIRVVSFGSERPKIEGQNEKAYAENRRAEFRVQSN